MKHSNIFAAISIAISTSLLLVSPFFVSFVYQNLFLSNKFNSINKVYGIRYFFSISVAFVFSITIVNRCQVFFFFFFSSSAAFVLGAAFATGLVISELLFSLPVVFVFKKALVTNPVNQASCIQSA